MRALGLYIHIPFCQSKCRYCDFYSLPHRQARKIHDYVSVICSHMEKEASLYRDCIIDSIFIGGGTPSLVEAHDFERLCDTIRRCFNVSCGVEFSLEANPDSISREKLLAYKKCGVNRLSIGMQSALDSELRCLGRIHTLEMLEKSYFLARECGFDNINLDIMYALPNQSLDAFLKTIERVIELNPEHISAYCLKIENGTPFSKMELDLPNEDIQYDMYITLCERLEALGYEHYEISNFAKNAHRCAHNLKYWRQMEYIGFGPASHSFFDGVRYYYDSDLELYTRDLELGVPKRLFEDSPQMSEDEMMDEYVMLALRLGDGISEREFFKRFKKDFKSEYDIEKFVKSGHMVAQNGIYRFSNKGFFVSNFILENILKSI